MGIVEVLSRRQQFRQMPEASKTARDCALGIVEAHSTRIVEARDYLGLVCVYIVSRT